MDGKAPVGCGAADPMLLINVFLAHPHGVAGDD